MVSSPILLAPRRVVAAGDLFGPHGFAPETITLDLANARGEVVEITSRSWKVIAGPASLFKRSPGAVPLPRPIHAASSVLQQLRSLLNLPDARAWRRGLAWLVSALCPGGPRRILILCGPSGSGKSTAARLLRAPIDPSIAPLAFLPHSRAGLLAAAACDWVGSLKSEWLRARSRGARIAGQFFQALVSFGEIGLHPNGVAIGCLGSGSISFLFPSDG
jgi:hypothetical protein